MIMLFPFLENLVLEYLLSYQFQQGSLTRKAQTVLLPSFHKIIEVLIAEDTNAESHRMAEVRKGSGGRLVQPLCSSMAT